MVKRQATVGKVADLANDPLFQEVTTKVAFSPSLYDPDVQIPPGVGFTVEGIEQKPGVGMIYRLAAKKNAAHKLYVTPKELEPASGVFMVSGVDRASNPPSWKPDPSSWFR